LTPKNIQWLTGELPKLVQGNIITQDQQKSIVEYYTQDAKNKPNIALIAFSIFGAILVAAGIILILAHNWQYLSRPFRTVISFIPLAAGQALGFWVIFRRRDSIAWCEGVSAFTFLALGSCIALISQTYHIQGDLKTFLLTWMILAIPLVYVFSSTTCTVLYLAGISSWAIAAFESNSSAIAYWLLFMGSIPIFLLKLRGHPKQAVILGWFMALSLIAGVSVGHSNITEGFRVLSFMCLFICLLIAGDIFENSTSLMMNPFHRVGLLGLAVTYLYLSFRDNWESVSYHAMRSFGTRQYAGWPDWIVSLSLLLLALAGLGIAIRRKNWVSVCMTAGLPLALAGFFFADSHAGQRLVFIDPSAGQSLFSVLFNLYVLAGGIAYIVFGFKSNIGKTVNFGFALVAAVIIMRFFDEDLSFVLRGIVFVLLGIGFLLTNVYIAKRKAK